MKLLLYNELLYTNYLEQYLVCSNNNSDDNINNITTAATTSCIYSSIAVILKTTMETFNFMSRTSVKLIMVYPSNGIFYVRSEMKGFNNTLLSGQRKIQNNACAQLVFI